MFGPVGARPYTIQRMALGASRDGTIAAIRQDVTSSTSTFENWIESSTLQTRMLYDVPNVETTQNLVKLNLGTPTFNRGPGESSGTFALESALDELADKLGIDPVDLRLKNDAAHDPESGLPFSSKLLRECYSQGASGLAGRSGSHIHDRCAKATNWSVGECRRRRIPPSDFPLQRSRSSHRTGRSSFERPHMSLAPAPTQR
jgi:CO/xanthine dehydrogenase Mo-binding subunit